MSLLLQGAAAGRRLLSLERDDPLKYFRFAAEGAKRLAGYVAAGYDTLAHTANKGTKTTSAAAVFTALCRGLSEVGGVRLPKVPHPRLFWVLPRTRKGQVDSSQKAYLEMIG